MAQLDTLIAANRHFEFFWVPSEDVCAMKTLNPTTAETLESPSHPIVTGRLTRYVRDERPHIPSQSLYLLISQSHTREEQLWN